MPDHGEHYVRARGEQNQEIGELGIACGHHCGVITVGNAGNHIGHCPCPECHNGFERQPNGN